MVEQQPPQPNPGNVAKNTSRHYALTPASTDLLRTAAHPHRQDTEAFDKTVQENETGTAPLQREAPLSPYMISPKYLDHLDRDESSETHSEGLSGYGLSGTRPAQATPRQRELQTAGQGNQNFHSAIAVPMAGDRIRRSRMLSNRDDDEAANRSNDLAPQNKAYVSAEDTGSSHSQIGLAAAGLGAGLAALWARGRGAMASGFSHTTGAAATGLSSVRDTVTNGWAGLRSRTSHPRKFDYSQTAGAHRRGIAGIEPKLPIIIPLMAILAILALGTLTGAFEKITTGNGTQATTGTNQAVGGRGAGTDTSSQNGSSGAGTNTNPPGGTTSQGAGSPSSAAQTPQGTANNGTSSGAQGATTSNGPTSSGSSGQGTNGPAAGGTASTTPATSANPSTPTAPDGTPLPVGGRGGGDTPPETPTTPVVDPNAPPLK